MDFVLKIAIIIGLISTTLGIVILIYKSGRHTQKVDSDIEILRQIVEDLNFGRKENLTKIEGVLESLNTHIRDEQRHVNVITENRMYEERKEQMRRIENGLEDLKRHRKGEP